MKRKNYIIPSDNRELQRIIAVIKRWRNYIIPSDNRELQRVHSQQ